ncbi:TFIIE1 [Mytilus coruscus]|uniref:TFIIE1 n=1 Tax=Mytilus coruscus TaxID=42192 RepID=A0A6J8BVA1_MYTCO|nr:TFIIE1 [Mytilus coruscus]
MSCLTLITLQWAENRSKQKSSAQGDKTTWSGDATRGRDFGMSESTVTITVDEEKKKEAVRERPVWMTERTGVPKSDIAGPSTADTSRNVTSNEIETLLIIHEKKSDAVPGIPADDYSSSDSEDEKKPTTSAAVEEMEDDDDEEGPMVSIGGAKVSIHDVTDDMVAKMTPHEKEEYIRLGQEMYQDIHE